MKIHLASTSCTQGTSCYVDPKAMKLLEPEELARAIGFGPDAFQVDDLLDFSNDVIGGPINGAHLSDQSVVSLVTATAEVVGHHSLTDSILSASHKIVDQDQQVKDPGLDYEFAELDWIFNFVEDSCSTKELLSLDYSHDSLLCLDMQNDPEMTVSTADQFQTTSPISVLESSATSRSAYNLSWETTLPGRARSKRSRSGSKMWSREIIAGPSQDIIQSDSCTDSVLSFDCASDVFAISGGFIATEAELQLSAKKPSKPWRGRKLGQDGLQTKMCSHCLTQDTPQWRAGPAGRKTLCNACGVRYKSGRLLPEYRPAMSPTFEAHIHSNSHRKVVEMRRQKEVELMQQGSVDQSSKLEP